MRATDLQWGRHARQGPRKYRQLTNYALHAPYLIDLAWRIKG
jgi:hypothetical protein